MMTDTIERSQLDQRRDKLLDQLAMAERRLVQLRPEYGLGSITEEIWAEAQQSVASAKQKLEALGYWFDKADEQDEARAVAVTEAKRREQAVAIMAQLHQLSWAMEEFDKARACVGQAVQNIEQIENELMFLSSCIQKEGGRSNFLRAAGIDPTFGTSAVIARSFSHLPRFAESAPFMVHAALQALAKEIPAVLDEAVRREAVAEARREAEQEPMTEPTRHCPSQSHGSHMI